MTKLLVDPETSKRLGKIRQRNTTPELAVRKALRSLGKGFRTEVRDLPGSPDIANKTHLWAIFVHGCFWHRHAYCSRSTTPKRNREFWQAKFAANVLRDRKAIRELRLKGFAALVIWECESVDPVNLEVRLRTFFRTAKRS